MTQGRSWAGRRLIVAERRLIAAAAGSPAVAVVAPRFGSPKCGIQFSGVVARPAGTIPPAESLWTRLEHLIQPSEGRGVVERAGHGLAMVTRTVDRPEPDELLFDGQ